MKAKSCIVSYVRDGDSRVRQFNTEAEMDRWIAKFEREEYNDSDSWIEYTVTGVTGNIREYKSSVHFVRE